jgi:hypothetical protein
MGYLLNIYDSDEWDDDFVHGSAVENWALDIEH